MEETGKKRQKTWREEYDLEEEERICKTLTQEQTIARIAARRERSRARYIQIYNATIKVVNTAYSMAPVKVSEIEKIVSNETDIENVRNPMKVTLSILRTRGKIHWDEEECYKITDEDLNELYAK